MKMNKKGFTLAEVLITLSILGVVAAISIPNVVQSYKRSVLKTQLKQAYSDVEQLSRMFTVTHNGINMCNYSHPTTPSFSHTYLMNEIANNNYIKIKDGPYVYVNAFGVSKNKDISTFFTANYKTLTNHEPGIYMTEQAYFKDSKNRDWFFKSKKLITIDINGVEKKPNRWGEDLFTFVVSPETGDVGFHCDYAQCGMCKIGNVGTGGGTADTNEYNGLNCTEYALRDVHPTDSSKKYWTDFLNTRKF